MRPRRRRSAGEASSRSWPSASMERASRSARSFCDGKAVRAPARSGATGALARPYARSRPAASSSGMSAARSAASATEPGTRAASSIGRTSTTPSHGGAPVWPSAARAWAVSPRARRTASGSASGVAAWASSRPIGVRASRARRASTSGHSSPPVPVESRTAAWGTLMRPPRSAALHELHRPVGRLVAGLGDRVVLLRQERGEHVVGHPVAILARPAGAAHADLHAPERVGAEGLDHRAHSVVAARAAGLAHADLAEREVDVVEDDHEVGGAQVQLPGEARHRPTGDVHEAARLDQVQRLALPAPGRDGVDALALEARMNAAGPRVHHALAHAVAGVSVTPS